MIKKHLSTVLVAMVTAAVTAAAPSLAAAFDARNADKVDGKHAVGSGASATKRKGKLVATDKKGRLPNNIIKKAPDANKLDGKDSTAFLGAGAKAADAEKLDGLDSSGFVKGSGSEYKTGTRVVATDAAAGTILSLPGLTLTGTCNADVPDTTLALADDWSEAYTMTNGGAPVVQNPTAASISTTGSDPNHSVYHLAWRASTILGGTRVVTIEVFASNDGQDCEYSAWGIDRGTGGIIIGPIFP